MQNDILLTLQISQNKNKWMLQRQVNDEKVNDFILKDQLKESQINMLYFLFNSEFQNLIEKFNQKTAFHIQSKKYQRSVSINSIQIKQLFYVLSQKLHEKIIKNDHDCFKALNKLQALWQSKKIEYFHRYYFEKYIQTTYLNSIATLIKNQEHLIRLDQHIYYSIQKTIWARQACLNHLRRSLKALGPQDIHEHLQTVKDRQIDASRKLQKRMYKVYGYRAKYTLDDKQTKLGTTSIQILSEDINSYRKLTYHLVQLVARWKMYMQSLTHDIKIRKQKIQFYYKQYNLFLAILNDASFISSSFLSNFYTFSVRNDPFLLKPILNLDKKIEEGEQGNFELNQLKKIINCKIQDIPKINSALEHLYNEANWNSRHQKYTDRKGLLQYKSVSFEKSHSRVKITPQITLKTNFSNQSVQKPSPLKITKEKSSQMAKSNVIIRKKSEVIKMSNASNIFKTSKYNPQTTPLHLLQSSQLKSLKEQIYKKVKDQLEFQSKKVILNSKNFADRIDEQVRQNFQRYLSTTANEVLQDNYQITSLSFYEEQISSYITKIHKEIPVQYNQMQINQNDLLKIILGSSYCYVLRVHTSKDDVANIIATVNRAIAEYKSIQIQLVSFKFPQTLQKIILKMVEFFWKYDNAKEIVLKLHYNNEQTKQFIKQLQKKLEPNCTIIQKKYKTYIQSKFIFTNKIFNKRYVYNPYAEKAHFKLYSALCLQKVQLQSFVQPHNLSTFLYYDYLIMQNLKRYTNSQDFIVLRDTFRTKDRLRFLLNQLMEIQNHKEFEVNIKTLDAQNFTQLNHKLKYLKKPLLQATDLILINNIKMIKMQYTLTIAYQMKALSTWNGEHSHRYQVKEEIQYLCDDLGCQFYLLPVQQTQHLKIIVFSASNYLKKYKKGLNMYLFETFQKYQSKWNKKYVQNIWVEMLRYPSHYTERQSYILNTYQTHEFDSINKQLIGENFDWFTDIQIQNGLQYKMQSNDIHLTKPLGVGVITNKSWILYCRIFDEDAKTISENV